MKLSGREDIALGLDEAFRVVTDIPFLERQVLRRGIDIVRTDALAEVGPGATWRTAPEWKGRSYPMLLEITSWTPPESAALTAVSKGLTGDLTAEFTALSQQRTRVRLNLIVRGSSFWDRMFLQSVSLTKGRLSERFANVVSDFLEGAELRDA